MRRLRALKLLSLVAGLAGGALVVASLEWYHIQMQLSIEGPGSSRALLIPAYLTIVLMFIGLSSAFVTLTLRLKGFSPKETPKGFSRTVANLSLITRDTKSLRVFVFSGVAYGLLFAILSSVIVFRLGVDFSNLYGVSVPSVVPVLCCGSLGQMPEFVIYLTRQFAILLIPINVILLYAVSWLVGLNSAIATYAFQHRPSAKGMKWMGGLGAFIALFTACPTCAGFFLLSSAGLTGAVTIAVTLGSYQGTFAVIGIPVLLLVPIITVRKLDSLDACLLKEDVNLARGSKIEQKRE